MQNYDCGCKAKPQSLDDRCQTHALWECHKDVLPPGYAFIRNGRECPPCFRAKVASVAVSPGISRLSYERITGHKPDMRGRENY